VGVGACGNYLSALVPGRAITCIASRDVFSESALLRQVFPRLFFLHKMNFEDVEERDGVYFVRSRPGGLISCFFQAFGCRGTFGPRLALRPIAP
jgi:hypothetical protein